ncbi:MAG TPA: FAD-dependent monooxygenase [Chitinophagaceae bacterium]|nr:FAD-dependent monooxygenase [Chitinophagaceae bacterium]
MKNDFDHIDPETSVYTNKIFDAGIAGGGLAGLSLSILCNKAGYNSIVIEKEKYPFHKVCGEYISFESWGFLEELGVPLSEMNLPAIRKLLVTAPNGKYLEHNLPLGGFGISRYKLDALLASVAEKRGAIILENTKVLDIHFANELFSIQIPGNNVHCRTAIGAFGKRSTMDVLWKRKFIQKNRGRLQNYIGVKYHIKMDWPDDLIALHNFKNGYCGISKIEDQKCCLCYLTTASNLRHCGNDIKQMEEVILQQNPFLKKIFFDSSFLFDKPATIAQISFAAKTQVENHVLLAGDAAGMIAPLCGNGMSMALHSSRILFPVIRSFLEGKISRKQLEMEYQQQWKKIFSKRLSTGRAIQRFFGSPLLSNLLISSLKPFPGILNKLISSTHGNPF